MSSDSESNMVEDGDDEMIAPLFLARQQLLTRLLGCAATCTSWGLQASSFRHALVEDAVLDAYVLLYLEHLTKAGLE